MAHSHGGAKIGTKVASVVSKSIVATHQKLVGIKHKLAMAIFHSISDMISQEVHQSLDPVMTQLYDELPESSPAKQLVDFVANETGQLQAGAGISMVAGSLLSSLALIINNELSPAVRGILGTNPHMLPDPNTIAGMVARGLATPDNGVQSIAEQGIDAGWGNAMVAMNYAYPDPESALNMYRRNLISLDTFLAWCKLGGIPDDVAAHWGQLVEIPLSPADAALAVLRGNMPMDQAVAIAAEWGVAQADFQTLIDNTGEPLGLEQLLEARRREFIDDATLRTGILQSRVRDEWIGTAEKLAYAPMSTSDAVNATVQNQLDEATAETIATQNGLESGQFSILLNTAGEPLSRTEMQQLYNRGVVTQSQVSQALRESRLKNKYNTMALALSERLLDTGHIADAVLYGVLTHEKAVELSMMQGYSPDNAAIIAQSAVNRKLQTERQQVMTSIVAMYEANAIDLTDATTLAGNLGFEPSEADFILQAAEFRRNEKLVASAMTTIRSKYIGHHIEQSQAQSYIDALGLPTAQRDQVLQLWTVERDANVRQLTPAQIVKAVTDQLITTQDGETRLMALGYNQTDADLLLAGA